MIHIALANTTTARRLPFFLALEEWIARNLPEAEYFLTWSSDPTVIVGRNQCIDTEVDTEWCNAHGVQVYRRRSGGGCVYADRNNLMLSYISPGGDIPSVFADYCRKIAEALRAMGLDVTVSGRNDLLLGNAKISGNAYYRIPGRAIVHGTLLCRIDAEAMAHAITPSRAKLMSKGVTSVNSRVTCIGEYRPDLGIDNISDALVAYLCDSTYTLTSEDTAAVERIEQTYYEPAWLQRVPRGNSHVTQHHIEGVGNIAVHLLCSDDHIADISITGDFFDLDDSVGAITRRLRGCPVHRDKIAQALTAPNIAGSIQGLDPGILADLIMKQTEIFQP